MKKLFILAAAIVAFASCSKEPEAIVNDGSIKFMSVQTRATETTDITDLKNGGFNVYGYTTGAKGYDVFTGVTATASSKPTTEGTTIWNTPVTKYWAANQTYDFVALYPISNKATIDKTARTATVTFNNTGEEDLVAAVATRTTETDLAQAAVALTFKHQLARVVVKFVNQFETAQGFTVKVSNVALKSIPTTATFTYTNGTTTAVSATGTADMAFSFDGATGGVMTIGANSEASTVYKYVIPTNAATVYKLAYKVEIYDGSELLLNTFETTAGVDLTSTTYTAGQSYLFTANVYDVINPINFTVEVEKWEDPTTPTGTITIGDKK